MAEGMFVRRCDECGGSMVRAGFDVPWVHECQAIPPLSDGEKSGEPQNKQSLQ